MKCLWYRSQKMKCQSIRSIGMFLLSLIFLHSSVWGALDNCLHNDYDSRYSVSEHDHEPHTPQQRSDSQDRSLPIIHCTPVMQQAGPAVLAASAKLSRSDKGVVLHGSLVPEAVPAAFGNDLWLEALFKRILTFSLSADLARHRFLSVLRI